MMTAEELEKTLEDLKQKVAKLEGGSFDSVEVRRKLVLREANGPIRAVLGLNDRGMVALGICDASGNPKLTLGVDDDDEPGISLSKGDSSTVLSVVVEDDEPRVCLYQGNGNVGLSLSLGNHGDGAVLLFDQEEKLRASLTIGSSGGPSLVLLDSEERERVIAHCEDDEPVIAIADAEGRAVNAL